MTTGANKARSVVIVGGGIAGLAAALCFARTGAKVRVYEQAKELKEVGAGLQITPNGAAVLKALGLSEIADKRAIRGAAVQPMDAISGKQVASFDLTRLDGEPYRFFHRADLLDILASGAIQAGVEITTDARAEELGPDYVRFSNDETAQGDLIVGADGLHSVVRQELNGRDAPFFTGQVAWRSVVQVRDAEPVARIWMGPKKHVVTYPLIGGRMNIVAVQERDDWVAEGWHYFDEPSHVRDAFANCAPELKNILDQMQTTRLWGLFRHPVAKVWHDDTRVILGDAAHPTLPFLAQGANLALEDAYVLADQCDRCEDQSTALALYQSARRDRVSRAIEAANANAVNYHLQGVKRTTAHAALGLLSATAPQLFLKRMDWLYGHDVTAEKS